MYLIERIQNFSNKNVNIKKKNLEFLFKEGEQIMTNKRDINTVKVGPSFLNIVYNFTKKS